MRNPVKAKLKAGKPSIGTWVNIAHPSVAEILVGLGFEWLTIDMQHTPFSINEVERMLQAMSFSKDCIPFVRVPLNDPVFFQHNLDLGAYGVVVPIVNTKEEAVKVVQACRYPPVGVRSLGARRGARYDPDYYRTANEEILVVVMIETDIGLKHIDEILSVKGVDAVYVGPGDFSWNLGVDAYVKNFQIDWQDEKFHGALLRILDACRRHHVIPGIHCTTDLVNKALDMGFLLVGLEGDDAFLRNGAEQSLSKVTKR